MGGGSPEVEPISRAEWRSWLAANGQKSRGVWLVIQKGKSAALPYPSPANKECVARLTAAGQMTEGGMAVVEAARADGSWAALDGVMALEVPADLREALDDDAKTAAFFAAFPPSSKKLILEWIRQGRSPETRRKRIAETVSLAAKNVRAR